MAIIPQDPFLFSGTVRENLDPCGRHREQQLLDVLEQCHLSAVVSRMGESSLQSELEMTWRLNDEAKSRTVLFTLGCVSSLRLTPFPSGLDCQVQLQNGSWLLSAEKVIVESVHWMILTIYLYNGVNGSLN